MVLLLHVVLLITVTKKIFPKSSTIHLLTLEMVKHQKYVISVPVSKVMVLALIETLFSFLVIENTDISIFETSTHVT